MNYFSFVWIIVREKNQIHDRSAEEDRPVGLEDHRLPLQQVLETGRPLKRSEGWGVGPKQPWKGDQVKEKVQKVMIWLQSVTPLIFSFSCEFSTQCLEVEEVIGVALNIFSLNIKLTLPRWLSWINDISAVENLPWMPETLPKCFISYIWSCLNQGLMSPDFLVDIVSISMSIIISIFRRFSLQSCLQHGRERWLLQE